MKRIDYDAVIAGGGPAGLGCALNFAKKGLRVLLVERKKIGDTGKTWVSFNDTLSDYGLSGCIENSFSRMTFSCYLGASHTVERSFTSAIDERRALRTLGKQARAAGAVLREGEEFWSFRRLPEGMEVVTSARMATAKLLVDATGRRSSLADGMGAANDCVDMGCYALLLDECTWGDREEVLIYDSFFPGRDYFWVVPTGKKTRIVGVFSFRPLRQDRLADRRAVLDRYMMARGIGGKVKGVRWGDIPLGPQAALCTKDVLFIGDSANTPMPSSGFGFHRCLRESELAAEAAARFVAGKGKLEDYRKRVLDWKFPSLEVHLLISDMLARFTDPLLDRAIGSMKDTNVDFLVSFLTGNDMSANFAASAARNILTTFSLQELAGISLKQDYLKLLRQSASLLAGVSLKAYASEFAALVRDIWKPRYSNPHNIFPSPPGRGEREG